MHIFYLDDSRDEQLCAFSAVVVPVEQWRDCLGTLKEFRRGVRRSHGIFVHKEFHAWKLVSGRGRISDRIVTKYQRCEIYRGFLRAVASTPGVRIFNAVFPKSQDVRALERLLNRFNRTLQAWDSYGLIISDQGKEAEYTRLVRRMGVYNPIPSRYGLWQQTGETSRNLPLDRIVEDPIFKPSEHSYFIQAADCVAYALLRRERPLPSKMKYGLHEAFALVSGVLVREATYRDPEGILRP